MQFVLMIYHTPEEFDMRNNDYGDPHLGAWRAYYKALVEAGVYVCANALEVPETGTTVRLKEGKRLVQDGVFASPIARSSGDRAPAATPPPSPWTAPPLISLVEIRDNGLGY